MDILFMCREFPPAPHGGTGSITYDIAKLLQSKNNRVYVSSRFFCKEFNEYDINNQYTENRFSVFLEKIPVSVFDSLYYAYRTGRITNKLLKKQDIDVVEAPSHGAESLYYSITKPAPLVVRLHGLVSKVPLPEISKSTNEELPIIEKSTTQLLKDYINKQNKRIMWKLEKESIVNADALISPSIFMKNFVLNEINELDKNDIKVIYNGINIQIFDKIQPSEEDIRRKYNIMDGNKIVCFAGRIIKPKGLETLIRAIPLVLSKYREVTFVLMGPIIDKNIIDLCKKINILNCTNIIFTGRINREEVYKLLKVADLLVHPSLYETFSMVILEAMASKKPVIASDIPPHKELISNGKNGFLFETSNYEDLADKILDLLFDSAKSKDMGINGYNTTSNHFSVNNNVEESLKIYKSISR